MSDQADADTAAGSEADTELQTVADELYALDPAEFTAARNARVKQARSGGDKALATAIGALRKPTVSAWAANLLARERTDLVGQLTDLGDALRTAQETLSGPELRALSTQRHRVVASIVTEARKLAVAHGGSVSDAVERELEATFDAALADPAAAAAVRSGRLTTALSYAGLGTPDLAAAPALAAKAPAKPAPATPATSKAEDAQAAKAEAQRKRAEARRAAEQAVQDAEQALADATAVRDEAAEAHRRAEQEREQAQQRVADLEQQLEQAQQEMADAGNRVRDATRAASRSERAAGEAERRRDAARAALARLGDDG